MFGNTATWSVSGNSYTRKPCYTSITFHNFIFNPTAIEAIGDGKSNYYQKGERIMSRSKHKDDQLTLREKEVRELLIQGLSNKEIGRKLGISRKTVETHVRNIYQKTNAQPTSPRRRILEYKYTAHCNEQRNIPSREQIGRSLQ
jgi:DNA-binding CsgD family transcriptional regulator